MPKNINFTESHNRQLTLGQAIRAANQIIDVARNFDKSTCLDCKLLLSLLHALPDALWKEAWFDRVNDLK